VFEFSNIDAWRGDIERVLKAQGPVLALLHVEPMLGIPGPRSPGPAAERARRFSASLKK
jgi:hypothetical protein